MNYDEMLDEEFYNLLPEEHEKYLMTSYKNIRKIEILEKLEFSQWTKEELLEVIIEYELIKLAQEKREVKIIELTTISKFVQDGTYKNHKLEFEEYKILEITEEIKEELKAGNKRKLRPCIMLKQLAIGDWTRRELLDLIKEYDEYVVVVSTILKQPFLSALNYIARKYSGFARGPFDQYETTTLKKIETILKKRNTAMYGENVKSVVKEKVRENQKILKIYRNEQNFIIRNIEKFTKYASEELNNLGYEVYSFGESYKFNDIKNVVKDDEVIVAIKK